MTESRNELIRACQRLSKLGAGLSVEEWRKTWDKFSELQDKHLAANEGLLDLEPLAMLEPGIRR
jgi:hypothetical protein